jgi:DNA-binding transcriptional MerR regulator
VNGERERWLHPGEAARYAGVTTPTLVAWTKTRALVSRRAGDGPRQYLASSLDAVLDAIKRGEPSCRFS